MTPIHRQGMIVLGEPADWNTDTDGLCSALPIWRDGLDGLEMYSFWRVTWRERLRILFGRPVCLCVHGKGHPPVALGTEK